MRCWAWVVAAGLMGCLQAPDVELADPDVGVADARVVDAVGDPADRGPAPDMAQKDASPPRPDLAPDAGCQPRPERCDGLDDDCDGAADEGLGLGEACTVGVGECQRGGVLVCAAGGEVGCSATPGAGVGEVCNGRDDDCDGVADEAVPTAPCVPRDCAEGVIVCDFGASLCVPPPDLEEDCAAAGDDDCDGVVDEGCACPPGAERPCGSAVGRCEPGVQGCTPDGWGACAGAVPSREERCDGVDDDCDGLVDEGLGGGPCDADAAVGACRAGTQACVDGAPLCLQGAPAAETCDGTDEDCDGGADEDFQVGEACTAGVGRCLRNGRLVCDGPAAARCSAAPGAPRDEACNRGDDDCDGAVDEGFAVGEPCVRGQGACRSAGAQVCAPDGDGVVCDAPEPGAGAAEICDREDNDCDGAVDEDIPAAACVEGVGACRAGGALRCVRGRQSCDATPGQPQAEICDQEDNDCDGAVDEGLDGAPCEVGGAQGVCADGVTRCADGELSCVGPAPQPERCDGVDDDCDGDVDEGVPAASCDSGLPGVCAQGATVCAGGASSCGPLVAPAPERCDGLDNDCDGRVDEGAPEALCPRGAPNATAACVAGRCEFACEPGFVDLDGAPGCERGCDFGEGLGVGLFPGATAVHAAADPEGGIGILVMVPGGARFQVLGGPLVALDVVGAASGALVSPAPGIWIAAISHTVAGGANEDGIEVFRLDGDELPLEQRSVATGAQATGLLGFSELGGEGDGAVFVLGQAGVPDNLVQYRATAGEMPAQAQRLAYPGLDSLTHLALAPVDGRGWLFGWDNRDDRVHVALADGQGVANPTVSPHPRADAVTAAALATREGIILATKGRMGRITLTRFDPRERTFTLPRAPNLPALGRFTLFAPPEGEPFVLSEAERGACQLWPLTADQGAGDGIRVPSPGCEAAAVVAGEEPGAVNLYLLGPEGGLSWLPATCQ